MNLNRLRWGEWIAAIAALDLLVVTFRAWYKVTGTGAHVTAWNALGNGRYLLIATAVVGIFLWLIKAAEDTRQLSFEPGWIAAGVGFICTVYVAYRLASPPSDALDPDIGIYLGLLSALGVTIGGLLSARQAAAAPATDEAPGGLASGAAGGANGSLVPDTNVPWSPAAPSPSTTGWSPATAAVAVPAATVAGAALGGDDERPLRSGDHVVLTAGGARYPAGTTAQVIEVFGGGALVEVKAADGVGERFEVPEQAYARPSAGGASGAGAGWSPAMPAAASQDWGFDEPANGASAAEPSATEAAFEQSPAEKVPWWKREIGGGKKKKGDDVLALGGGAAAGAAAASLADRNGSSDEKPGLLKRLFGGAKSPDPETEALDVEAPEGHADEAAAGDGAESDTSVGEEPTDSAVDDVPSTTASERASTATEAAGEAGAAPAAAATGAAAVGSEPTSAPEPEAGSASEPEVASAPEPDAGSELDAAAAPEPDAGSELDAAAAPEPDAGSELDAAAAPEPEVVSATEPHAASEPEVASASEPHAGSQPDAAPASELEHSAAAAAAAPEPDSQSGFEPGAHDAAAADPGAARGSSAAPHRAPDAETASESESQSATEPDASPEVESVGTAGDAREEEERADIPKRNGSSGSRKIPAELLAAVDAPPKIGDEVQLKIAGGKFEPGARGTVVDVFSAGVIVELNKGGGRTERVDLPFEAIGPAEA